MIRCSSTLLELCVADSISYEEILADVLNFTNASASLERMLGYMPPLDEFTQNTLRMSLVGENSLDASS